MHTMPLIYSLQKKTSDHVVHKINKCFTLYVESNIGTNTKSTRNNIALYYNNKII